MTDLHVDIETYSDLDLADVGVYKYTEHRSFKVLWIAYSLDGGPTILVEMNSKPGIHYSNFLALLLSRDCTKHAWNAQFERTCLAKHTGRPMHPEQWRCTMVKAANLGLPLSLEVCARVLDTPPKDPEGTRLMKLFSMPQKPTKKNGNRTRIYPEDAPEDWKAYGAYCQRDVEAELAIDKAIQHYKITSTEQQLWNLDQRINDRGIRVDLDLAREAVTMDRDHRETVMAEARELTGLANPGSRQQLIGWLDSQGLQMDQLTKTTVQTAMTSTTGDVYRALQLRQQLSKTSIGKYQTMIDAAGSDSRLRGMLQFYGANRTGRWAGRLVQLQNLPRINITGLDTAREIVKDGDQETLELIFDTVPGTLSQLIRTAFIPEDGQVLTTLDFSAIEARVIAWLAREEWLLDVFRGDGRVYEATASRMFNIPIEQVDKAARQRGKVATLALGYQGGAGALMTMGALEMGLTEDELGPLVVAWRQANPRIVRFWKACQDAAMEALLTGHSRVGRFLTFTRERGTLHIILPSGRRLSYWSARLDRDGGWPRIKYQGMNQTTKKWEWEETYGGKLAENITQAIARDLLADKLLLLDDACHDTKQRIVAHVHDEIILEGKAGHLAYFLELMERPVFWAPDLPLRAEGAEQNYYHK